MAETYKKIDNTHVKITTTREKVKSMEELLAKKAELEQMAGSYEAPIARINTIINVLTK